MPATSEVGKEQNLFLEPGEWGYLLDITFVFFRGACLATPL